VREIRRAYYTLAGRQIGDDLLPSPGVVSERDRIGAGGENALGVPGREPRSASGVLGVDEAEIDRQLPAQARQVLLKQKPSRRAEDVS
jgi:hypothetical protein